VFGWAICDECYNCIKFKAEASNGSDKFMYGTMNMTDHAKIA